MLGGENQGLDHFGLEKKRSAAKRRRVEQPRGSGARRKGRFPTRGSFRSHGTMDVFGGKARTRPL